MLLLLLFLYIGQYFAQKTDITDAIPCAFDKANREVNNTP